MAFEIKRFLGKKHTPLAGIDISSTGVKILQLERSGKSYQITGYATATLSKGVVVNGVIEKLSNLVEALDRAVKRSGMSASHVAMAMPSQAVTSRLLNFPQDYPDNLLEAQIEADASLHIPFPLEDVRYDFCRTGKTVNANEMEVLLAAARREQVDGRINSVEAIGLTPSVIDIETYCVQRSVAQMAQGLPGQGAGLILAHLDMGALTTTLTVVRDDEVLFEREQPFGGQQLTQEIAKHYGISPEEAESKKRLVDLPDDYPKQLLKPFIQNAAAVAARSLQFFYTSTPYGRVDQLLLAGGTSLLPGMTDAVTQTTQVPVVLFSPIKGFEVHKRVNQRQLELDAPMLSVAFGLAMRAFDSEAS